MRFPRFVPFFTCIVLSTFSLFAQSPDGNLNGMVSDPSTAAVVGAEVVAVNDVTGVQYTTKTNNEGIYVLPSLPPGPYRIQVSKAGFKTIIKPDIVLNVQDALSINFTLPIGAAYEVLTVEGGAPLVNTESAAVSTVVDQTYVQNMPLNGRSFQDLILLTPGVVTQTPQNGASTLGMTGEFSVSGQRPESNYYTVDGVSANVGASASSSAITGAGPSGSIAASTALGTTQALVSVDDLQEFRVQSSTYSAEFGRNPGGQFSFETKSGVNQWHGTAYDYLRNGVLDAQDWFNDYFGTPEPIFRQNDFGGTFGGPIEAPGLYDGKEKTFFFVSYEGLRLSAPEAATVNFVPDATMRTNAPAPLNQVLNAFPVPNGPSVGSDIAEFIASWSSPSSLNSTSVRLDHAVNDKLRLFFRFSDTGSSAETRGTYLFGNTPTSNQVSSNSMRTYTAGVTSVLTNRFSNEFRVNYSSNNVHSTDAVDAFGGSTPIDLARLAGLNSQASAEVSLSFDSYQININQLRQSAAQRQWNLVDAVSLSLGGHQLKFGLDYRRLSPLYVPLNPNVGYFYFDEASVETNSATIYADANAPAYPLYVNFAAFVQDDWKPLQRLILSLGLRWELDPAPSVTQGLNAYTIQGSGPDTWTLAPQGTPLWRTTWYNFAPRAGVAYILHNTPGRETVVRGGGGVFFDTGQQLGSMGFSVGPGFFAENVLSGPFSGPVVIPQVINPPVLPLFLATGFYPHLQLPYTIQWSASIEQALGKSQSLTMSYIGAHGKRLLKSNSFLSLSNPTASFFSVVTNGLTSDYDSLQFQLRRRLSRGLTVLAAYTWSHCIDYGSQNYFLGYTRGNCDFDVRHNLSTAFSYDFPNMGQNRFRNAVLHYWGLDDRFTARTGFPITLNGNETYDPVSEQYVNSGLDMVPGQPLYIYGTQCAAFYNNGRGCPGGRAVNPDAFTDTFSGLLGNAPRNFIRGFGEWQMDLAVRREFPIYERLKLQFRAEAFNIFNHPNFGRVNAQFGQATFGQATATLANSLGVLSPLYQTGGSRSMQFALKLIF